MKLLFEGWKKFLKEAHEPVGPGPSAGELMGRARENFPPDVLARAGYGEEKPEEEPEELNSKDDMYDLIGEAWTQELVEPSFLKNMIFQVASFLQEEGHVKSEEDVYAAFADHLSQAIEMEREQDL